MPPPPLQLPVLQNWSCHNCGGCCKQHAIEVTLEERRRIESQNWIGQQGFEPGVKLFTPFGPPWNRRYRLAHRADGSCIFLDDKGLCRIHAKFGEPAKPLACRIYPYAFHPAGSKVTVSLRYSCPSVVANLGKSLAENKAELQTLERLVVPEGAEKMPPPEVSPGQRLDWKDFLQFPRALDDTFANDATPFPVRLLQALGLVNLIAQARFEKIQGPRLGEFLAIVRQAALEETPTDFSRIAPPSKLGMMQFRQLVAQYARKDTDVELRQGWRARLKLLSAAIRFSKGTGQVPVLQTGFESVPFAEIERDDWRIPPEADELLTRYLRVKIQGLHFCGPAYYDVPFTEGFYSLALIIPATLWIARWWALSHGRSQLTLEDIQHALTVADHHHGYSPIFGSGHFRSRVRQLHQLGDIPKLCVRYTR
ncbi:MAG: YkgJ family cysteine cluster protein [Planctomycetales bacterium]